MKVGKGEREDRQADVAKERTQDGGEILQEKMALRVRRKELPQFLGSIAEDALDIRADEKAFDPGTKRSAGSPVMDLIDAEGSAIPFLEQVFVVPELVGAAALFIDEPKWRFPGGDFALPTEGQSMQTNPVIDPEAGAHFDRFRRENLETEPRRGDVLEVVCVGEEREDLGTRVGEPEFGGKRGRVHLCYVPSKPKRATR